MDRLKNNFRQQLKQLSRFARNEVCLRATVRIRALNPIKGEVNFFSILYQLVRCNDSIINLVKDKTHKLYLLLPVDGPQIRVINLLKLRISPIFINFNKIID
jgi:hypothetical protein